MLTVMIKWNKSSQKLKIILSFLISFSLICSVGAACLRPHVVYAGVAGTIAGYILTLFASFNTAITNPEVVTAINNTFGQMSMIEADAALIDQGIASIAASTGFDMASIFANTAEEAAQVIASAPPGSALAGAAASAATAGFNIAAGAGECAVSATGAVLPAIAGVVLPAAGAVALGVAGGVLINHIRNVIKDFISAGKPINSSPAEMQSSSTQGFNIVPARVNNSDYYVGGEYGTRIAWYPSGNKAIILCKNYTSSSKRFRFFNAQFKDGGTSGVQANKIYESYATSVIPLYYGFSDKESALNYLNSFDNGIGSYNFSPDIVSQDGNLTGYNDNGDYKIPALRPAYTYGSNVVNYIDPSDYDDFINDANHNTDIGDTEQDPQGDLFDGFINPYIAPVEDPSTPENPDQPENPENPVQKPTVPYPDPEEYPDAIPEVNPVPDTDIAPTAIPYPELPEPTDTEITETNDKITPFDLRYKFPFCLPFDIHKALTKLKGAREAPYFVWTIPFGDAGEQTVTVDLRAWDEIASILRLLELLLFIVGLAVATRNLIGGT